MLDEWMQRNSQSAKKLGTDGTCNEIQTSSIMAKISLPPCLGLEHHLVAEEHYISSLHYVLFGLLPPITTE